MGDVLTEVAKEFPEKYPTPDAIVKADFSWIWNRFNGKRKIIDIYYKRVFDYVNDYLKIKDLLK